MSVLFTKTVEPKQELDLLDYINELDLVVKPALRIMYDLEEDSFNMSNQDLKSLLFTTMEHWDRIDEIFMKHNRRIKGLPEVPTEETRRNIWQSTKLPKAENQTVGA